MSRRHQIIAGYVRLSSRRPFVLLLVFVALTALAGWGITTLDIHMDLKKLLPQNTASVQALDEMEARRGSSDLYTIAVESPCARANVAFIEDLTRRIEADWPEVIWVQTDEDPSFFRDHALLYLPTQRLWEFRDQLSEALRCELQRVNPAFVEVGDVCTDEPVDWSLETWVGKDLLRELGLPQEFFGDFETLFENTTEEMAEDAEESAVASPDDGGPQDQATGEAARPVEPEGTSDQAPTTVQSTTAGGFPTCTPEEEDTLPEELKHYIISENGRIAVLYVQLDQPSTDVQFANRMEAQGRGLIAELDPTRYHPSMRAEVVGAYQSANEAREAVNDSTSALIASIFLVVMVMFLFFRNARSLLVVLVPLAMGITWTMGLTALTYKVLNLYTMFVGSVLIGMGIDYGIHLYGRAMEGFKEGLSWEEALTEGLSRMLPASIAAALTTIGGFCTLLFSHFQGFIEFGVIASYGIGLCVIACYLMIPPMVFAAERIMPLKRQVATAEDPRVATRPIRVFAGLALIGMVAAAFLPWAIDPETEAAFIPLGPDSGRHLRLLLYLSPALLTGLGALLNTCFRAGWLTAITLVFSVLAAAGWAMSGHELTGAGHSIGYWLFLASLALAVTAAYLGTKGIMPLLRVVALLVVAALVVTLFLPWSSKASASFVEGPLWGTYGGSIEMAVVLLPALIGGLILWVIEGQKGRHFWAIASLFLGFMGIALWMVLDSILPGPQREGGMWLFLLATAAVGLGGALAVVREGNNRAWLAPLVAVGLLLGISASLAPKAEFEYDFRNLRGPSSRAGIRYGQAVGRGRSTSPSIILGRDQAQMREVHQLLRERFSAKTVFECENGETVEVGDGISRRVGLACTATPDADGAMGLVCPPSRFIPLDEPASLAAGETCIVAQGGPDPLLKGFLTIETYVPDDQEQRMEAICAIAREINRSNRLDPPEMQQCPTEPKRALNRLTGEARDFVDVLRRMVRVTPFTLDDVPEWAIRTLTERDGSMGRIGLVFRQLQEWNVLEVTEYQKRFALLQVPSGEVHLADATFITSDVIWTVQADGARMGLLVVIVLCLVMVLLLRTLRGTLLCLAAMGGAFLLTLGLMVATGSKLGMYNMIVIPAVLGVSIDGAIYLYHRNAELKGASLNRVMTTTGVAIAASSLTTIGGFAGLLFQRHMGIRSIGQLAIVGILSALVSVFLLLPGLLVLFQKHKGKAGSAQDAVAGAPSPALPSPLPSLPPAADEGDHSHESDG
ncbi:MAG: MMPL family transporter [Bradymonadales bacterium]|nr:MMPL family transporter [Bradymonadales bacterium]